VFQFPLLCLRQSPVSWIVGVCVIEVVPEFIHRVHRELGRVSRYEPVLSQGDLRPVIELPVFARHNERQMGPDKSGREKERFIFARQTAHCRQGLIRNRTIDMFAVRDVHDLRGLGAHAPDCGRALAVGFHLLAMIGQSPLCLVRPQLGVLGPCMWFTPRLIVRPRIMEYFSIRNRVVAVFHEVLRNRDRIGGRLPKPGDQIPHLRGVRSQAGHDAHPRRIANGDLTIGAVKHHRAFGECIDVRRLD